MRSLHLDISLLVFDIGARLVVFWTLAGLRTTSSLFSCMYSCSSISMFAFGKLFGWFLEVLSASKLSMFFLRVLFLCLCSLLSLCSVLSLFSQLFNLVKPGSPASISYCLCFVSFSHFGLCQKKSGSQKKGPKIFGIKKF